MTKYHISSDGTPRPCGADKGHCPYGADVHGEFDSPNDARKFAEEYLERNHSLFEANSRKAGQTAREASQFNRDGGDDFRSLNENQIREALLNPGSPIAFNEDGSLSTPPSGSLQDPIDLANLKPEEAERLLKAANYSDEQIANLKSEFGELSDKALITAATAELMTGPPQRHVRFSEDPDDNYSFSMTNFEEVGRAVGILQEDPNSGFIVPVKDPKAALSWMQVSNPANNVFMIQEHTGTNRLYMPQTANSGVAGEAGRKLNQLSEILSNSNGASIEELAKSNGDFRRLQRDLRVEYKDLEKLRTGEYGNAKDGTPLTKEAYVSSIEVNGRDWMMRDLKQTIGVDSSEVSYGASELSGMKPTQSGISVLQVQGMANATIKKFGDRVNAERGALESMNPGERAGRLQQLLSESMGKATIVTRDNYILDGHHGLAKAALMNSALANGTVARRLEKMGISFPLPSEARLPVVKLDMDGGQGFDALTYWTEKNGFPVSGMK